MEDSLNYIYNVLDNRIKAALYGTGGLVRTTWYAGSYEKTLENSFTKHYYYINGPDGPIALAIQTGGGTPDIYYLCKDHLGSITGVMESDGDLVEEYNYDAWGRRRNPSDWSYSNVPAVTFTQHGFTGHEHLDMFNLINMNGRVYDSEIARFVSPDPIIQDSYNILSYNRYSYCLNNPLKYTDPSGYSYRRFWELEMIDRQAYGEGAQFSINYPGGWGNNITHKASNYYANYQLYQEARISGYEGNFGKFQTELYKQIQVPQSFGSQRTFTWETNYTYTNGTRQVVRDDNNKLVGIILPEVGIGVEKHSVFVPTFSEQGGAYLKYDADYMNSMRTQGSLIWYNSDGTEVARYTATSGSGNPKYYTLPAGKYSASNYRTSTDAMFKRNGIGFIVSLGPLSVWDAYKGAYRTDLLIHPARYSGTQGCVGLIGNYYQILDFETRISNYLNNNKTINVIVEY